MTDSPAVPFALPAAASPAWSQALLDRLPCGLALFDAQQRLRACNPLFHALLGLPEPLPPGLPFAELVALTQRGATAEGMGLQADDGAPAPQPRRTERRLASGAALSVHTASLPDGSLAISLLDQSAQQQAAEAVRRTRAQVELLMSRQHRVRQEARRAVEGRQRFIANIAHELRTPVNAIQGMLQLIDEGGLPAHQQERMRHAREAAQSLIGVMDDILDFAAVEAGQVTLSPQPFALEQLLRELAASLATLLADKRQEVVFDVDPALPPQLVGDARRLRQILAHLGSNAIKFGGDGAVVLRLALVGQAPGEVTLEASVIDHGIGIDPERLQSLMQDFGQGDAAASRRFGGNGLGLAICRELLRLMGSELQAQSQLGQGSRFGFRLTLPAPAGPAVQATGATEGLRVLLADARPTSRQALARMAGGLGWQVSEAESPVQLMELLRGTRQPGAVLVDWQLGGPEPFAAALRAGEALAGSPAVVLAVGPAAGRAALARLPQAQRRRLAGYVGTPATPGMLDEAVAQAQARTQPSAAACGPTAMPERPLQGLRILVAEDNENNQIVTRDLLRAQGADVQIAIDGLDTLTSIVANGHYDVILMDWQMPNMDGLEATREIRQIVGFKDIPIIALTANASAADRAACLAAGMDAHLGKPVDARELVATLLRHTRPGTPAEAAARAAVPPSAVARPVGVAAPMAAAAAGAPAALAAAAAPASAAPAPPRIDRDAALARLGGDAGLYARVLERFRQQLPQSLAQLEQAWQRGERKEAHRLAHTLKGNAGTIGAVDLSDAARTAEHALAGSGNGQEAQALEALRGQVQATLQVLGSN